MKDAKKKTESLENELLKIDNELFELEKKYGEFRVKKSQYIDKEVKEEVEVDRSQLSSYDE